MDLAEAFKQKGKPIPKNLNGISTLLETIQKYPNQSPARYCELMDISKPTFYRYLSELRSIEAVHQKFHRPTSKAPVVGLEAFFEFVNNTQHTDLEKLAKYITTKTGKERDELTSLFGKYAGKHWPVVRDCFAFASVAFGYAPGYSADIKDLKPTPEEIENILSKTPGQV